LVEVAKLVDEDGPYRGPPSDVRTLADPGRALRLLEVELGRSNVRRENGRTPPAAQTIGTAQSWARGVAGGGEWMLDLK
jgi:hypothetical protein